VTRRRSIALGVLLVLLGLWVYDRGLSTVQPGDSAWVRSTADDSLQIVVDGVTLRVLDVGQGTPLLLLHGWSDSTYTWHQLIPRLQDRYRLVAFDWPGFGYSDKPAGGMGYEDLVGVCDGVLDGLGIGRAIVVGNSMGGGAAVRFAADRPQRTLGLVAIDAAAAVGQGQGPWLQSILTTPGVGHAAVWVMGRLTHRVSLTTAVADGDSVTDAIVEEMYLPLNTPNGRTAMLEQFIEIKQNPVTRSVAARVRVPTLVLWGREDSWIPLSTGETLRDVIPGARLEVLDHVGHLPQWEAPEVAARLIDGFVRSVEAGATPAEPSPRH